MGNHLVGVALKFEDARDARALIALFQRRVWPVVIHPAHRNPVAAGRQDVLFEGFRQHEPVADDRHLRRHVMCFLVLDWLFLAWLCQSGCMRARPSRKAG